MLGVVAASYVEAVSSGGAAQTLTIASGKVASDLTSFPVRIDLSHMSASWWAATAADLGNVRVKQGATALPIDIVSYDRTAKTGEAFFKAPTLLAASANAFTVDPVSGAAAPDVTDPIGRNAVWSDFARVQIGSHVDRTGKNADSTVSGSAGSWGTDGFFDCAGVRHLLGLVGETFSATHTLGVSVIPNVVTTLQGVLTVQDFTGADSTRWEGLRSETSSKLAVADDFSGPAAFTGTIASGTRYRGHFVQGAANRYGYQNGSLGTTAARAPRNTDAGRLTMGGLGASTSNRLNGKLGWVYYRNGELSADWIAAECAAWESTSTFYTIT